MEILTAKSFESEIADGVSIVDFFAQWCRPCLNFAPIFEKFSIEFASQAKFAKVDIDQAQSVAADYGVLSIPTIIAFKNGREIERKVGSMSEIDFRIWLNKLLSQGS